MSTRRNFFALIGNAAVTGLVAHRATAATPTLILPPAFAIETQSVPQAAFPLLAQRRCQMDAFIDVKAALPDQTFLDWLERGLRQVEAWKPGGGIRRAYEADLAAGRDPWGHS